ncbi:34a17c56-34bc-4977-b6df-1579eb10a3c7 [Sclerotinia trifoliorum]|uniref:34a17c56-34bc-4977-b6df-1579eb10a3c7 n=1 Tax=Sclerotinia trifoliorum TaxID=28548 RepID=A0A8H2ZYC3_9HELO|nr:34a17c56-34bc-4977-b6df-1579eb10a3c7 [Sclerotinia trifoliorum]
MANTVRKKAWRPKSKTGCLTCRTRRVKCGEEKPQCLRYTKTGRKCDAYDPDRPEMSSTGLARRAIDESSPIASSIASPTASIIAISSPVVLSQSSGTVSFCRVVTPILPFAMQTSFTRPMQGNYQAAFAHLNNYPNGDSESSLTLEFIRSELLPLFGALDIQTTTILPTSRVMMTGSIIFDFRTQTSIPDRISSLNEAKYHLQNHEILEYHRSVTKNYSLDMAEKGDAVRSNGMNAMMKENRRYALQLEQWCTFELMASLAESLLKSYGDSRMENGPVCSFNTVIIPSLVFVVYKCRDPSIRRKAHALLSSSFRQEGLWDSEFASGIGKWSIDKEEKGLENISRAEEVLGSSRIVVSKTASLGRRRALIKFRQGSRGNAGDLDLQEELIVW